MKNQRNLPKILLLGISYPDVYGHMEHHDFDDDILSNSELSVDQAIECVRRKILTEMDGRDLARCVATEQAGVEKDSNGNIPDGHFSHNVYTVSKEVGGVYRQERHVYANFNNSRGVRKAMSKAFGEVQFQQVILDYYWMPTGWLVTRWNKTLFQQTLPDLVRYNLLEYPRSRSRRSRTPANPNMNNGIGTNADDSNSNNNNNNNNNNSIESAEQSDVAKEGLEKGVVFLPFCAHVCKELVGGINILKKYFAITFVKKSELSGHALWKGTMSIDAETMQQRLGKRLDQEEVYCTFKPSDIYQSMEDAHVTKDDVMRMLLSIEDFDNIRMIRLRPLRQHEPPSEFRDAVIEPEEGGFIGLNWAKGRALFNRTKQIHKPSQPILPLKLRRKPQRRRRKATRKPIIITPVVVSAAERDFVSDTDSASSGDESIEDTNTDEEDNAISCFDPYESSNIPDVTNYYPYPALDINSYFIGKETIHDDHVMSSWAETWGPKTGRKKNRKQDILQNEFKKFRKMKKSYLSSNGRLPNVTKEDEGGYKWTLDEKKGGWVTSLNGDAPDTNYESKIVGLAKRDYVMTACRQLFEMKNPGFKTLSRVWQLNSNPFISCYQIPKESVMTKIERAAKKMKKFKPKTVPRNKCNNVPTSSDEFVVERHDKYSDNEAAAESESSENETSNSVDQEPTNIDLNQDSSMELAELADVCSCSPTSLPIVESLLLLSKYNLEKPQSIHDVIVEDDLPPFKPKLIKKHLFYDLTPHVNFVQELYRLLQDVEEKVLAHIISWQSRDRSFIVHDRDLFERIILSECCGGVDATYDSFILNLTSFGFSEIKIGSRRGGYRHELFRRGKPKKLALISQDEFVASSLKVVDDDTTSYESVFDLSCKKLFIENLYCLLQDSERIGLADVISWKESGKSFKIHKPKKFSAKVLKKASRVVLFKSFCKSLIDFGFELIGDCNSYEHPNFIRGDRSSSILKIKDTLHEGTITHKSNELISKRRLESKSTAPEFVEPATAKRSRIGPDGRPQYDFSNSSKFPQELYNLLEDSEKEGYTKFIRWMPSGDSFEITNSALFENSILRRSCTKKSYKSFSSFEDAIVWFGFDKIEIDSIAGNRRYRHQQFIRGEVNRLDSILPKMNDQSEVLVLSSETKKLDLSKSSTESIEKSSGEALKSELKRKNTRERTCSSAERKLFARKKRSIVGLPTPEKDGDVDLSVKKSNEKTLPIRETRKRKCRIDSSPLDEFMVVTKIPTR